MAKHDWRSIFADEGVSRQGSFMFCAFLLDLLLVLSCWGSPGRIAAAVAVCTTGLILHAAVFPRLASRVGESKLRTIRCNSNAAIHLLKILITQASVPSWAWLVILGFLASPSRNFFTPRLLAVLIPIQVAASMYFGIHWLHLVSFVALTLTVHVISRTYWSVLTAVTEEQVRQKEAAEQAKKELQAVHAHATQQEKLSSLGLLASGIAHEINNPLASMKCNLSQLTHDLSSLGTDPSLLEEYDREILPETLEDLERVRAIITDLQLFARGDAELPVQYNLNDEIRLAVRVTEGHFAHTGAVGLDLGSLPLMIGFPRQVAQVLVNLLVNASHAIRNQGTVKISSGADWESIWFRVSDTGVGMSADVQSRIFDPFFTTKQIGERTGLGLAVVHGIVSGLDGHIEVESAPGAGTTFTIRLPLVHPQL